MPKTLAATAAADKKMRRNHQIFTGESGFAQTGAKQSEAEIMKPEPASCAELMLEKNAAEIQIR